MKNIFISAGEQSGDLHGSNLITEILKLDPSIEISGLGNNRMIEAGMRCIHNMSKRGVMWSHTVTKLPELLNILSDSVRFFKRERPDLVVLIDYCGLNFYLARAAKRLGIPVMYYISPQVWAHGIWRVKKIKKLADRMVVIYPFEEDIYKEFGVPATYVGNPIVDELTKKCPDEGYISDLKSRYGDNIIALLPGSRDQEIGRLLPILLQAGHHIHKEKRAATFIVSCAEKRYKWIIEEMVKTSPITAMIIEGNLPEVVNASRLCLAGSGTVTLKIAYYLTPMIIIYKVSPFAYFIAKPFCQSPYLSLVNKLAEDLVVPERLMYKRDIKWLVSAAIELMDNPEARKRCTNKLQEIRQKIGGQGASRRAAMEALGMINM